MASLTLAGITYLLAIRELFTTPRLSRGVIVIGLVLAAVWHVEFLRLPPGADDDIHRYVWDGRLQRLGYNPYIVVPSDPAAKALHTPETSNLNNPDLPSPYPAGAQLVFRAVTAIQESTFALKLTFVVCEFAVVFVLLDILRCTRQGGHLVLAFAWNPLLAIEVAGSGHIDIVGALLLLVSAAALLRRWRATATVALGLAIAVKFLPIVLLPVYWKRVRSRDVALGAAVVGLLYVPFLHHGRVPIGSLGTYVRSFRFNGPVFAALDGVVSPQLLVVLALLGGLVNKTLNARLVGGPICLAHGSNSFVRPGSISMVPSVAAAIFDVGLDAADHYLDCEHYSRIYSMALARTGATVGGPSGLGDGTGIRMRGDRCRDYFHAPESTSTRGERPRA
jgi:alpha-1,6-mannosyltransferase